MNEIKTLVQTPEQLAQILELQLSMARGRRAGRSSARRPTMLIAGVLLILVVCAAALLFLQRMVNDLRAESPVQHSEDTAFTGEMKKF